MRKVDFSLLFGLICSVVSAQNIKPLYDQFSDSWGYVNKANMWVLSPAYEAAENFTDDGKNSVAPVMLNRRWGAIDLKGKTRKLS